MTLCIFEDDRCRRFDPLTLTRPVFDLRCGIRTLSEKLTALFPGRKLALIARPALADVMKETHTGVPINEVDGEAVLFLNGRVLGNSALQRQITDPQEGFYFQDSTLVAALLLGSAARQLADKLVNARPINAEDFPRHELTGLTVLEWPWDLISVNGDELTADFQALGRGGAIEGKVHESAVVEDRANIYIGEGASIKPGAILDPEEGPIYIAEGAKVLHNAVIIGPAYVGPKSAIKMGAKIYENTSIGPVCKVGGEVEGSIIHGFSNKQHEGFLGHAYLGEWVNIAADCNNSDLKNNYSTVKFYAEGEMRDTGSQFVGTFMGDHTKVSINTMLNTGSHIGAMCNIMGAVFPPKYVPSFLWGNTGAWQVHDPDKAFTTARRVMARRDRELTPALEKLYRQICDEAGEDRVKLL